jgi:hypothetical protein
LSPTIIFWWREYKRFLFFFLWVFFLVISKCLLTHHAYVD